MDITFFAAGQNTAQLTDTVDQINGFIHPLGEKRLDPGPEIQGSIQLRVAPGFVCAHGDQITMTHVVGVHLAETLGRLQMKIAGDARHGTAHGRFDVHRWINAAFGDVPGQHDVPIQNGTGRIHNGIVLFVAFSQHGVKAGDRPAAADTGTGSFHQLGKTGENRWRITFRRGRLPDSQSDLPLGMGEAGQ